MFSTLRKRSSFFIRLYPLHTIFECLASAGNVGRIRMRWWVGWWWGFGCCLERGGPFKMQGRASRVEYISTQLFATDHKGPFFSQSPTQLWLVITGDVDFLFESVK
jgi:hypothetical protein